MELNELIKDCARRQKKGLHFILSLIVGLIYPPAVLAALMIVIEAVFSVCLFQECKK